MGAHLRTGGKGLGSHVLPRLRSVGGEAVQVFVGNPRGWRPAPGDPKQDALFRALCEEHEVAAFIHTPYLVNLGSPTEQTYTNSIATVAHNLRRGVEIGARGVVVHTGSCVAEGTVEAAMKQVRDGLLPILETLDDDAPMLLLEPTAGQGRSLCAGVDDIEAYLDVLDGHPKVGVCLDTCHVFAAGAPLDRAGGMTATLDRLVERAGAGRLRLVHANDSKDVRGAFKDRHERIGTGRIGLTAFAELFGHRAMSGVPVVLETPGGDDATGEDIATLKELRGRA